MLLLIIGHNLNYQLLHFLLLYIKLICTIIMLTVVKKKVFYILYLGRLTCFEKLLFMQRSIMCSIHEL